MNSDVEHSQDEGFSTCTKSNVVKKNQSKKEREKQSEHTNPKTKNTNPKTKKNRKANRKAKSLRKKGNTVTTSPTKDSDFLPNISSTPSPNVSKCEKMTEQSCSKKKKLRKDGKSVQKTVSSARVGKSNEDFKLAYAYHMRSKVLIC